MSREIYAVRVRELPTWAAQSGVQVWCGSEVVQVQGSRLIASERGWSRDKLRRITLSFVQEKACRPLASAYLAELKEWARCWFSEVGSCSGH